MKSEIGRNEYVARGNLAIGLAPLPGSNKLPTFIGPFKLDYTPAPNALVYLDELGVAEPEWFKGEKPDWRYPNSLLYLERKILVSKQENPRKRTDEMLDLLETLIRLFQPGEVSVRRHSVWRGSEERLQFSLAWNSYDFKPIKPLVEGVHDRPEYSLETDSLEKLCKFAAAHWDTLYNIPTWLKTALNRFNSSYEKRDLADRLIDLVIALEALFGDGEHGSVAYKVAIRCAYWLQDKEKKRYETFSTVKDLYSARSRVVHGELKDLTEQRVDDLESIVRASVKKFLNHQAEMTTVPNGKELDKLMLTNSL